jgi:carbonic anhydrase/acetyltransferase-like protein (isoleucine patch superfamily)
MENIRAFAHKRPRIAPGAWIDAAALVIGDVAIGPGSSVWPMSVLRGDIQAIRIGRDTNIQDGSVLHVTHDSPYSPGGQPLIVGNGVTVGHRVILHACTIGDHCLIGMGSIVLDGAVLEPRVMLGAGSLVSSGKRLEGGYLWLGAPARRVRPLSERELAYLEYSAQHYVRLAQRHKGPD